MSKLHAFQPPRRAFWALLSFFVTDLRFQFLICLKLMVLDACKGLTYIHDLITCLKCFLPHLHESLGVAALDIRCSR